jgi:hypothetical protein
MTLSEQSIMKCGIAFFSGRPNFLRRHSLREPTLTPGFGSRASEPAEQCREMTLTFESRACADLDERQVAFPQ